MSAKSYKCLSVIFNFVSITAFLRIKAFKAQNYDTTLFKHYSLLESGFFISKWIYRCFFLLLINVWLYQMYNKFITRIIFKKKKNKNHKSHIFLKSI